ncbi:hypothetical protein [Mesorhizobium silamurunense]|nr:hypothetical protein [Mesorhizobium silamurunense]
MWLYEPIPDQSPDGGRLDVSKDGKLEGSGTANIFGVAKMNAGNPTHS